MKMHKLYKLSLVSTKYRLFMKKYHRLCHVIMCDCICSEPGSTLFINMQNCCSQRKADVSKSSYTNAG